MPSGRQSAALVAVLVVAAFSVAVVGHLVRSPSTYIGSLILLFLAFYWLMTGRLMGRPGWSFSNLYRAGWGEWFYLATASFVLVQLGSVLATSAYAGIAPTTTERGAPPFNVRYEREMTREVLVALHRFPDSQSCLEPGADARLREDLARMDWDRIVSDGDAQVCVFRLLYEWGGVAEASDWLRAQGFMVGETFSSQKPLVELDGTLRVTGGWSISRNGPLFPATGLVRRMVRATAHLWSVDATYSADGKTLQFVRVSYSTL